MFYESISSASDAVEYGMKRAANIIDRLKDIEDGLMLQQAAARKGSGDLATSNARLAQVSAADEYKEHLMQGFIVMIKRAKENHDRLRVVCFGKSNARESVGMGDQGGGRDLRAGKISLSLAPAKKQ